MSPDTILPGNGYDVFGLSRYAYVEGNPETGNDPAGHCFIVLCAVQAIGDFVRPSFGPDSPLVHPELFVNDDPRGFFAQTGSLITELGAAMLSGGEYSGSPKLALDRPLFGIPGFLFPGTRGEREQQVANALAPIVMFTGAELALYRAGALPSGTRVSSVDDVLGNPGLLKGQSPGAVRDVIGDSPGWQRETLGQGTHEGQGWVLREYDENGNPTGRVIRWHPGDSRHGPDPYWRVSSPEGGKSGIIPGGPNDLYSYEEEVGG